ncbi:MAG: UxaA family hydrolase [Chloroflexota bacterium]
MLPRAVILDAKDNVATALANLKAGEKLELGVSGRRWHIVLANDIPFGHKFALTEIKSDAPIVKYGEAMGKATVDIKAGAYVHVHNVASNRGRGDLVRSQG